MAEVVVVGQFTATPGQERTAAHTSEDVVAPAHGGHPATGGPAAG